MKNNYAAKLRSAEEAVKRRIREAEFITKTMVMDIVTIALGDMGLTPEQIVEFRDLFLKTEKEYATLVCEDAEDDAELVYSKEKIDRALKEIVPEEMFVPYEERYKL